jgi:hypothetical protein
MREVPCRLSPALVTLLTLTALTIGACGTTSFGAATGEADAQAAKVFVDCNEQLRSGKLNSYRQAAACAENKVILAYAQAGYPYMDLVLFDLQERRIGAERIDFGTAQPAAVYRDIGTLDQRLMDERERRIAARSGIGGAVPATRPEQLLAGLDSLTSVPATKDTACFSVGDFRHCNNGPPEFDRAGPTR